MTVDTSHGVASRPRPRPSVADLADRLAWTSTKSGALLDEGTAMTQAEALEFVAREFRNSTEVRPIGRNRVRFRSGYGFIAEYVGTHPIPLDPHAVLSDFAAGITGWSPTAEQGGYLVDALRAAIDGDDKAAVASLLAFLAATGASR